MGDGGALRHVIPGELDSGGQAASRGDGEGGRVGEGAPAGACAVRTRNLAGVRRRPLEWEAAAVETLAVFWRCRLELLLLGAAVGLQRLLAAYIGEIGSTVVVAAVGAVVVSVGPSRRVLWRLLRRAWLSRAWARATLDSGLAEGPFRVPRVLGVSRVAAGDVLRVRVRRGQSVRALEARREELAACLRVREIRLERERADAADVRVTLVRRDPFDVAEPLAWPAIGVESLSLWEPIPIGV